MDTREKFIHPKDVVVSGEQYFDSVLRSGSKVITMMMLKKIEKKMNIN